MHYSGTELSSVDLIGKGLQVMDMLKINDNFCKYQVEAISATKFIVAKKLKIYSVWNGINLTPSLERFLITLFLNSKAKFDFSNFDFNIKKLDGFFSKSKDPKKFLKNLPYIRKFQYKLLSFLDRKIINNEIKFLFIVHHDKFIRYFIDQHIFEGKSENMGWLALHSIDKDLIKRLNNCNIFKLRNVALEAQYPRFLSELFELAESLERAIIKINPKVLVVFEGDAPYHSLVSEIGKKHKLKMVCFQWGIFYKDWKDIAFSNMNFDYFLSWGEYFSNQLKHTNKISNYINFGYPVTITSQDTIKEKIIFLGQYVAGHIQQNDFNLFLQLCKKISSQVPGKILFRPHPNQELSRENLHNLEGSGVSILDTRVPVLDQMSTCLLAVSISSSSLIEALFCDTIPVVFNPTCTDGYHVPLKLMGLGEECSELGGAEKVILDLASNKIKIAEYLSVIRQNRYKFLSNQYLTSKKRREFFEGLII
jgi:hypothetical protein